MDKLSRMILHFLILKLFFAGNFSYSRSQELKFEHIGPQQGLAASNVISIVQDRQGFIWFGTTDGLYRFDGYRMTVYKNDPLDSLSLGNNHIFALLEDSGGNLWIGTAGGGLNRFDRNKEQFVRYLHNSQNPGSLSADVVSALFEDSNGNLWIGTWNGLNRLNLETGTFTRYVNDADDQNSMNPHWIRTISEDSTGVIWVGTDGGISRFGDRQGTFNHFVEDRRNPNSLSSNGVSALLSDRSGTMWIGSWGGLDRFDHQDQRFKNCFSESKVTAVCEDIAGKLWIGTDNYLLLFDKATDRFTRFVHDPLNSYSLGSNAIRTIYEDRTGALWIGTNNGVNRLDREQFRFQKIVHNPNDTNSLSHKSVGCIDEGPKGDLWIATASQTTTGLDYGINKFNRNIWQFDHSFPGLEEEDIKGFGINQLYQDRFGIIWIASRAGLGRYDPSTEQFTRFKHDPNDPYSLSGNFVWRIHEDQKGRIWVAIHKDGPSSIDLFDREHARVIRINFVPEIGSGENQRNGVHSISEGQSGRLWFATMGEGIFLLNPDREEFIHFAGEPGKPKTLSHGWVGVVHEDRAGMVWAAPWYGGLNKLDPESGLVTIYTEKNGLPSNYITSIVEDKYGNLWLTTQNGLSCFDPHDESIKNFDKDDGLLHTNYGLWNTSISSSSGKLYFGGMNGIDIVHPDSIHDNPHIPPVVFTKFTRYNSTEANGNIIEEKGVSHKNHFDLTYEDHTLSFEFAALNYRAPQKNQYTYKLEGFSDNWIHLGSKHDVTFTNLDPGKYKLHVKGSNNDGVWNEEGASLILTISPPWWQTGWAYTLYAIILGMILYGLRRFELRRTYLKNELEKKSFESRKLKEVDELKSRFFANISHEFRTPLTLILGPLEKWLQCMQQADMRNDFQMAKRNAHRLKRLINQLLDLSKIEAGKMELKAKSCDIVRVARQMVLTFSSFAESKSIALDFSSYDESIIAYFDLEKVEKIISNLLSNAIKFTPEGGKVEVALSSDNGGVEIRVTDTGIGIPADRLPNIFDRFFQLNASIAREQEGTGIGLALTKEFVELHKGGIRAESQPQKGSTFIVSLPLGREHLNINEIVEDGDIDKVQETEFHEPIPLIDSDYYPEKDRVNGGTGLAVVLVVEDNHDMRRYIYDCLSENYSVLQAENGLAGQQTALGKMPDLIISDVMMPEMDGFEFCEKIKSDVRTSHIPVILLTARASIQSKFEGLETGADDYLTKPFDIRELQVRIKNLIALRQRLKERFRKEVILGSDQVVISSSEEEFLNKLVTIVQSHMADSDFTIENFSREVGLSRVQLHRKLHALTGLSASRFIRALRLKRAVELMKQQKGNVSEIAFEVGFNSLPHFNRSFREQYNRTPSEYISNPQ